MATEQVGAQAVEMGREEIALAVAGQLLGDGEVVDRRAKETAEVALVAGGSHPR